MNVTNETQLYQIVGENIKKFRKGLGLKQAELADQIDLSRTSLVNIEQGRQHASLYLLWRIADCLNIELHDLLPLRSSKCEYQHSFPNFWAQKLNDPEESLERVSDFMNVVRVKSQLNESKKAKSD